MAHKKLAVFIGRFQPFHNGHLHVIKEGLKIADTVLVLVGSASSPRSYRNPFTYKERKNMITKSLTEQIDPSYGPKLNDFVKIDPLNDFTYNDNHWVEKIQQIVQYYIEVEDFTEVILIGHSKDSTSYYLKMFPQWDSVEISNHANLSSTPMRNSYFSNIGHMWVKDCDGHNEGDLPQDHLVPTPVKDFLEAFLDTPDYKNVRSEYEFIQKYKASWLSAPYPPIFVTVDAVVVQSGHILLVKRGAAPGKGLWAMPGGFINQDEKVIDACIRELREETGIKVPDKVLRGSIVEKDVFDDPNRSSRGRTITHAFLIHLEPNKKLPKVKGADDAEKAKWIPISKLRQEDFFEDHYHVIQNMIGRI